MLDTIKLWLINKLMKGSEIMVAMLFADKICNESVDKITGKVYTFADVPPKLREQVAEILIESCRRPDLVPAEFGGSAKAE